MSDAKFTRHKVLVFVAVHSRFSWEDIVEYRNSWVQRILEGISNDKLKSQEVRDFATEACESNEWKERRYE